MLEVERLAGDRFETGSTASSKPAPLAGLPFQHQHKHHSTCTSTGTTSGPLHSQHIRVPRAKESLRLLLLGLQPPSHAVPHVRVRTLAA
jgi:hypothetical protein